MPSITKSGAEMSTQWLIVILYNHHKMFSRYQIIKEYISDAITSFHNNDYINLIVAMQIFGISINTVH